MNVIQNVGGGDIRHVEGRVLAEMDHIEFFQGEHLRRAQLEMRAVHVFHPKLVALRKDAAVAHEQLVRRVIEYAMPAILRFQHQREG